MIRFLYFHKNLIFIKIKFYSFYKIKFYFIREFILLFIKNIFNFFLFIIKLFSKIKTIKKCLHFQQWISWFTTRWRTQQSAISHVTSNFGTWTVWTYDIFFILLNEKDISLRRVFFFLSSKDKLFIRLYKVLWNIKLFYY